MPTHKNEAGSALLMVLLLLMLVSAMLAGFTTLVMTDTRVRGVDRTRTQAFYAAHGALEQLTTDLGHLFLTNYAPTLEDVQELTEHPPAMSGVTFETEDGSSGYVVRPVDVDQQGNPIAQTRTIGSGPYQGFLGLVTEYTMDVTARTRPTMEGISESRLERRLQTVQIPLFQFGVFSETDLSFHAGSNFDFGGRVHTNGNLFLAAVGGFNLFMRERVSAVGEVVREKLANNWDTSSGGYSGSVQVVQSGNTLRPLALNEGSVKDGLGSEQNEPKWTDTSIGQYHGNIRNGRTGARRLELPFVTLGATPIDLIRRGTSSEMALIRDQRYYSTASLRILLSDTAQELTSLPGVTADAPVPLEVAALPAGQQLAMSRGNVAATPYYRTGDGTPLLAGFIKIEMRRTDRTWEDVTQEILGFGITGRNQVTPVAGQPLGFACPQPNGQAILRLQRVRNDTAAGTVGPGQPAVCGMNVNVAREFWPNVLYDTREANRRDNIATNSTSVFLGGVMHYVELDVANLSQWFRGTIGVRGSQAFNVTGYTVYFSDRRTNKNASNVETGEYGFEDFVNPSSSAGTPNNSLNNGEDVNGNGQLDTYGQQAIIRAGSGATAPLTAAARPVTDLSAGGAPGAQIAMANRAVLFRRALKLTNGGLGNIIAPGLTIVAENPVYVQGDWNANNAGFVQGNVATAVIADAVTLLSNNWSDHRSFVSPNQPRTTGGFAGRPATTTWYRLAVLAGKGRTFPYVGTEESFGGDGGVHNFLRYLENWDGQTVNYMGAIASFYYNRQALGIWKCCNNVYGQPDRRNYAFDINFLTPALLPPQTPMFRDLNALGFTQVIR